MAQRTNAQVALQAAAATFTGSGNFISEAQVTRRAEVLQKWLDAQDARAGT